MKVMLCFQLKGGKNPHAINISLPQHLPTSYYFHTKEASSYIQVSIKSSFGGKSYVFTL